MQSREKEVPEKRNNWRRFVRVRGSEESKKMTCLFPAISCKLLMFTFVLSATNSFGPW